MPHLNLNTIKEALFENPDVRHRIVRDFSLDSAPESPSALAAKLLENFQQEPLADPLNCTYENNDIYRAAVLSLASNSRSWATFLNKKPQLERVLSNYDSSKIPSFDELRACLPGLTGSADAKAILRWQELLQRSDSYYDTLVRVGNAFRDLGISQSESTPCVAAFIGAPPSPERISSELCVLFENRNPSEWKAPGMGPTLASEFLRNLGWSGFKPDRHVIRLLKLWVPTVVEAQQNRAIQLASLFASRRRELIEFLTYSLTGVAVTPPGTSFSAADNLVWALGAYVEKKDRESSRHYLITSTTT